MENGGPAFPQTNVKIGSDPQSVFMSGGMSLRDWFAGMALSGMMKSVEAKILNAMLEKEIKLTWVNASVLAYKLSDAMIKERGK